jgi:PIN domain nuclease of toxin-antitoxin system
MPERFVLDSFALMALFQNEPGAPKVEALLEKASKGECQLSMSVVNLGEVAYAVEGRRGLQGAQEALSAIDQAAIQIVDVDRTLALMAARLKATTGMGYADCFAAALAQRLGAPVLTGDPDFQRLEPAVAVEWLAG